MNTKKMAKVESLSLVSAKKQVELVQSVEISAALMCYWERISEQEAHEKAIAAVALEASCDPKVLSHAVGDPHPSIVKASTWLAFLLRGIVLTEISTNDVVASNEVYQRFRQFWKKRNQDARPPTQKILSRCLRLSGFQRVKGRSKRYWKGFSLRNGAYL